MGHVPAAGAGAGAGAGNPNVDEKKSAVKKMKAGEYLAFGKALIKQYEHIRTPFEFDEKSIEVLKRQVEHLDPKIFAVKETDEGTLQINHGNAEANYAMTLFGIGNSFQKAYRIFIDLYAQDPSLNFAKLIFENPSKTDKKHAVILIGLSPKTVDTFKKAHVNNFANTLMHNKLLKFAVLVDPVFKLAFSLNDKAQ